MKITLDVSRAFAEHLADMIYDEGQSKSFGSGPYQDAFLQLKHQLEKKKRKANAPHA